MAGFTTSASRCGEADLPLRDAIARGVIPGPRILTSLEPLVDPELTPDSIRALVRHRRLDGADFVKIFASASIREGGRQTWSDEQLKAACGEAKAIGLRTMGHAHSPESMRAATQAGCTQIEHGAFATQDALELLAQHGKALGPASALMSAAHLRNQP